MKKIPVRRPLRPLGSQRQRVGFVNLITASALICGILSIIHASLGHFFLSAQLIMGAMILDGLDGTFARLLKAESAFGAEFDTFVDITCFGIAPGMLVYYAVLPTQLGMFLAAAIALSGATRLARFKVVDPDHGMSGYTGMPITANAGCLAGLIMLVFNPDLNEVIDVPAWLAFTKGGWLLPAMIVNCVAGLLLQVSTIRYPKPTNTPLGQFIAVLAFIGLFMNKQTAVYSCFYLVPVGLGYIYLAPLWFAWKRRKTA